MFITCVLAWICSLDLFEYCLSQPEIELADIFQPEGLPAVGVTGQGRVKSCSGVESLAIGHHLLISRVGFFCGIHSWDGESTTRRLKCHADIMSFRNFGVSFRNGVKSLIE